MAYLKAFSLRHTATYFVFGTFLYHTLVSNSTFVTESTFDQVTAQETAMVTLPFGSGLSVLLVIPVKGSLIFSLNVFSKI